MIMSGGVKPPCHHHLRTRFSKPSHNSDRGDESTDNETVLCLLPVVAFDSPHLDPAHRGHTLYAVRLNETRKIDMGSDIGVSAQEGSDNEQSTPKEGSNDELLPPLAR